MRGPARVDSKVVNHGEWLNHDSNHPCCCVRFPFASRQTFSDFFHRFSDDSGAVSEEETFLV